MIRKRVPADELIHLVIKRLSENDTKAISRPAIGIVPHEIHGWAAVTSAKTRRNDPDFAKQVERIQADLRKLYLLAV